MKKIAFLFFALFSSALMYSQVYMQVNQQDGPEQLMLSEINEITFNVNGIDIAMDNHSNTSFNFLNIEDIEFTDVSTQLVGVEDNSIRVYPVPTDDVLNIDLSDTYANISVSVVSMSGTTLIKQEFENSRLVSVDVSQLKSGIYACLVKHTKGDYSKVFIKK